MRVFMAAVVCWLFVLSSQSLAQPNLLDASIEELQEWLRSGQITSAELVTWYQQRIDTYDQQGPFLNAIQHHNSNALAQAVALDEERMRSGPRSVLHGIPVVVKDNYETVDMPTTAGSAQSASSSHCGIGPGTQIWDLGAHRERRRDDGRRLAPD